MPSKNKAKQKFFQPDAKTIKKAEGIIAKEVAKNPARFKAPISFRIKRSPKTKQFRCVVRNEGNNEIVLTGEPCKNRADVVKMIQSVLAAIREGRVAMIDDTNPKPKPVKFGGPI